MTTRDRTVLAVVVTLALLAAFWLLALSPRRHAAADLTTQITAAQARLDTATASAGAAESSQRRYDADYATVARLGKAVPVDDDVPSLLVQLQTAAARAKTDFRSIKLGTQPASAALTPAPTPAAANQAKSGDGSASPASTAAATAPATQTAAAGLPPGAAVGAAGFPTMPFDFAFTGSFFHLKDFLKAVDRFTVLHGDKRIDVHGRLLTVDGISLTASAKGFPNMNAKIHATAYLLPAEQGLTAGATPTAPAGPSVSAQPASTPATPTPTPTAAVTASPGAIK